MHELDCDVPVPHHLFREDELRSVWEGFHVLELERKEYHSQHDGADLVSAYWEVWAERI